MKYLFIIATLLCTLLTNTEIEIEDSLVHSEDLEGTFTIDLRPTPDAAPYLKEFTITHVEGTDFSGSFYDTPFENGKLNLSWDIVYFAFTTTDQTNTYYHSGSIEGNDVYGITYSPQRQMTAPWRGSKSN